MRILLRISVFFSFFFPFFVLFSFFFLFFFLFFWFFLWLQEGLMGQQVFFPPSLGYLVTPFHAVVARRKGIKTHCFESYFLRQMPYFVINEIFRAGTLFPSSRIVCSKYVLVASWWLFHCIHNYLRVSNEQHYLVRHPAWERSEYFLFLRGIDYNQLEFTAFSFSWEDINVTHTNTTSQPKL